MRVDATAPLTDFRTATIENHWNDPPETIFQQTGNVQYDELERNDIVIVFENVLKECQAKSSSGLNKRILDDTARRIQAMRTDIDNISLHVMRLLSALCKALQAKDWETATRMHTDLMKTEYEKYGSWLTGLKRLIETYQKL
ncbi:hypothetical protein EC973_004676 [Apophysomyces ossiformis]|uniref:SRA1/Sec31 domain-containing protein n=1 Tax=Apophysomyces ossiformis TaxID=679940 RepID=A0A8H7EPS5_9FUNG|nr:hypothetical protein EC973_004676 [Apophysomyces ossiformis]